MHDAFQGAQLDAALAFLRRLNTGNVSAKRAFAPAATRPIVVNPQGSIAREKARICTLTFICSAGDPHPTNAGYRAIAAVVWAASGYNRGTRENPARFSGLETAEIAPRRSPVRARLAP